MESRISGETDLTRRESQVAELIAWGASKKEVPGLLKRLYGGDEISVHTVENILRNIYSKIHISKSTELSAWWFCRHCGVEETLSPIHKLRNAAIAVLFLVLISPQIISPEPMVRPRGSSARIERVERIRRKLE